MPPTKSSFGCPCPICAAADKSYYDPHNNCSSSSLDVCIPYTDPTIKDYTPDIPEPPPRGTALGGAALILSFLTGFVLGIFTGAFLL